MPAVVVAIGSKTASGWRMSVEAWWNARAAVVAMVADALLARGDVILTPEMVLAARGLLAGETRAAKPPRPAATTGAVRAWWMARRAVVDILGPYLDDPSGTVLPVDVAEHARQILAGERRPPILPDANAVRVTRPAPYAAPVVAPASTEAPF